MAKRKPEIRDTFSVNGNRRIYRYFDGSDVVAADPIKLNLALLAVDGLDLDEAFKLLNSGDDAATKEAWEEIVAGVRQAFRIPEYAEMNGKSIGLTDSECYDLLLHFDSYLADLKKNTPPSVTSAPSTARVS